MATPLESRKVEVFCGPGGALRVAFSVGARIQALYDATVDTLRQTRAWAHVTPLDVVLWRVSCTDIRPLQQLSRVDPRFKPMADTKQELSAVDYITDVTIAADDVIWVELLGGELAVACRE